MTPPSLTSQITHWVTLTLLSTMLVVSLVHARSFDYGPAKSDWAEAKRLNLRAIKSFDAILAYLKDRPVPMSAQNTDSDVIKESNFLERKRKAVRLNSLGSLLPRVIQPKRQMFWSPLGYMGAAARKLMENNPQVRVPPSNDNNASPVWRYG